MITARRVMRPADTLTEIEIGTALDRLGRADRGTLFVVEPDGRPIGLLFARDVHGSSAAALGGAIRRDFPRAAADAKLAELFEACALGLPIAVVERDGRLAGVVHPGDVFIELARESRVAGAADKPPIARTAPPEPAALETSHG